MEVNISLIDVEFILIRFATAPGYQGGYDQGGYAPPPTVGFVNPMQPGYPPQGGSFAPGYPPQQGGFAPGYPPQQGDYQMMNGIHLSIPSTAFPSGYPQPGPYQPNVQPQQPGYDPSGKPMNQPPPYMVSAIDEHR